MDTIFSKLHLQLLLPYNRSWRGALRYKEHILDAAVTPTAESQLLAKSFLLPTTRLRVTDSPALSSVSLIVLSSSITLADENIPDTLKTLALLLRPPLPCLPLKGEGRTAVGMGCHYPHNELWLSPVLPMSSAGVTLRIICCASNGCPTGMETDMACSIQLEISILNRLTHGSPEDW